MDVPAPQRVLAVGAHPDDVEFYAGGTLLRLRDAGSSLTLVVCSDGARGGAGADLAALRRAEQDAAASLLGVESWRGLGHPDGALRPGDPLRRQLVGAIRHARPMLLLAHDPRTLFTAIAGIAHPGHSDHRAAGQATLDAVYPRAASPHFEGEPDGAAPWLPREVWLFDTAQPDHVVDVADVFERKLDALRAHASQEQVAGGLVAAARACGAHWGSAARPAEGFVRLRRD
jgi:LmbE family N-acetylglucosaminyl deacetylase